ncbi:hypothetical protein [Clostridium cavendishii]|nr:hypothetical protein [Clostridium cavendishii]
MSKFELPNLRFGFLLIRDIKLTTELIIIILVSLENDKDLKVKLTTKYLL